MTRSGAERLRSVLLPTTAHTLPRGRYLRCCVAGRASTRGAVRGYARSDEARLYALCTALWT